MKTTLHAQTSYKKFKIKRFLTFFLIMIFACPIPVLTEPVLSYGQPLKRTIASQEPRKDPFSLPPGIRLLSQEVSVTREDKKFHPIPETKSVAIKPEETHLKLKAILITDHVRLASIDRSIVTIGDSVNGEKVLEIRPDRVILEKEGKKRTILLDPTPVKITVEGR